MLKKCVIIAIFLSGIMLTQCGVEKILGLFQKNEGGSYTIRGLPRELKLAEVSLATSSNAFGLKLFKEIVLEEQDKNVFISPLSVSMALGMTYNGAAGTTEEAMRNTLEYGDLTQQEINESYRYLSVMLANLDPMAKFQIANSIWYRLGHYVPPEFININRTYFDAEVSALDFGAPNSKDIINDWVNEKTNGKIKEIVTDSDMYAALMFLINAIYFKGTWKYEFDPDDTQDALFNLFDGTKKPCRMMYQENDFHYFRNEYFQAVDLPYGDSGFSMIVFLPHPDINIDDLISELNQENWNLWGNSFSENTMELYLPKFKLEYDIELKNVLASLGMGIAFTESANFSGLGGGYIDKVLHKTFVDVNEEGTEAAAVTVVGIYDSASPAKTMRVDRPFIFAIREKTTGTILFMGKIVEPVLE